MEELKTLQKLTNKLARVLVSQSVESDCAKELISEVKEAQKAYQDACGSKAMYSDLKTPLLVNAAESMMN